MKSRLINRTPKTYAVVFETGDEAMAGLEMFARENGLSASQFTAIGAFESATLGFFNFQERDYRQIPIREQVEVLSFLGDITLEADATPRIHAHVVLGKADGTAHGGHLIEARVRPTLEVIVTEAPQHLHRVKDPETGLTLIQPEVGT